MKRKIEQQLASWKETKGHLPLIIKGIRQCGKTYSVLDFVRKNYQHYVYINFLEDKRFKSAFNQSFSVDDIIISMSALTNDVTALTAGGSCIVLDEIQECPEARTALKFFHLDGRFDVIGTGSLLGVSGYREEPSSIPVGYETVLDMYPMDFEEFLWAQGIPDEVIGKMTCCMEELKPIPEAIHERMFQLLLQYTIIGGMPAVVENFTQNKNAALSLSMQRNLLRSYEDDMVKYAATSDKSIIRECFRSIPKQLGKENKKFQYSVVRKGATASRFRGALQWIEDAGIIRRCHNLNITGLPLDGNAIPDIFKVYMSDTGLFVAMLEDGTQSDILQGNLSGYKGAIFENLVADMLGKQGRKLYYFHKDSGLEVDFVIRMQGKCVLMEVKATTGNTKSSKTILAHPEKYGVAHCIKFGRYNIGRTGGIITMPLYAAAFLASVRIPDV
ncbi:MAG: ATP-binding protein [Bacteroidales bacterium]|nr:ATP-binding protein [Bacteroidales bacterium]